MLTRVKVFAVLGLAWLIGVSPDADAVSIEDLLKSTNTIIIDPYQDAQSVQAKCAGWSDKNWFVSLVNGEVQISSEGKPDNHYVNADTLPFEVANDPAIASPNPSKTVFPVNDGYLIALNAGEWGGSLWWYSKDGKYKKVVLPYDFNSPVNSFVNEFMPTRDGLYVLTGLAHLSSDEGGILKIENIKKQGWRPVRWIDLNSNSQKYYQINDANYLILANKKVALFSLSGKSMVLYEPLESNYGLSFGGNSVVQDKAGIIYVGDRYKVIRLKPVLGGHKEDWIIPEYCEWDVESDGVCHCRNK